MWLTIRSREGDPRSLEIAKERLVIGREEGCDLLLEDDKVSREHAALSVNPEGHIIVEDLRSTNGTYVNGRRITEPTHLGPDDELRIGESQINASVIEPGTGAPRTMLAGPGMTVQQGAQSAPPSAPSPVVPPPPPQEPAPQYTPPPQAAPPPMTAPPPVGAPQAASPPSGAPASPSRIERIMLRKSVKRAQIIAAIAGAGVLIAILVVVLFVTGAIGGEEEEAAPPPTASEIITSVKPSTAQIRGIDSQGQSVGLGSGWVLDAQNGLIVTNGHVTNEASEFTVRIGDQTEERPATVVGVAPCEDLAVLKVQNTQGLKTLPLGSQANVQQGDQVIALGYPASLLADSALTTTQGVVSIVKTSVTLTDGSTYANAIQTDAAINPGNSGGPLVNLDGELVGVNTFKTVASGIEGQFYAIGVDRVKLIAPDLREGNSIGWNGMGFFYPTSDADFTDNGFPIVPDPAGVEGDVGGLIVARTVPGTVAANAGFNANAPASIEAINGQAIDNTLGSYCSVVGQAKQGETATFSVYAQNTTEAQQVEVGFE